MAYGIPVRDGVGAGGAGKFFRRRRRRLRGPDKITHFNTVQLYIVK